MKFYMRDPDRAIAGMAKLTLEQVGAYNLILDQLYACDGIVPDDDAAMARFLRVRPARWQRLKAELMAADKIRRTHDGLLTANGVENTRRTAVVRSQNARSAATLRWENYRKAKQINNGTMRTGNASTNRSINTEISTASETSGTDAVDNGENFGAVKPHSTLATGELEAIVRAKRWK